MNVLSEWNSFACRGLNVPETRWYKQQIFISHWKAGKPTNQGRPPVWFALGGPVSSGSREQRTSFLTTVLVKALIPPARAPPSRPSSGCSELTAQDCAFLGSCASSGFHSLWHAWPHDSCLWLFPCLFFVCFGGTPVAYKILVPPPGINLMSPELEAWSLNHWTAREMPPMCLLISPPYWLIDLLSESLVHILRGRSHSTIRAQLTRIDLGKGCGCVRIF